VHGAPKAAGSCGGELRRPVADGPADMLGVGWVSARSSEGRLDGWTGRWGVGDGADDAARLVWSLEYAVSRMGDLGHDSKK